MSFRQQETELETELLAEQIGLSLRYRCSFFPYFIELKCDSLLS
jgi:hypothetical protein